MKMVYLFIIALLSGCGSFLKSEYQQPALIIPDQWQVNITGEEWMQGTSKWWTVFDDPKLTHLINDALVSNNDLALTGINLILARLNSDLTKTNLVPELSTHTSSSHSRQLNKSIPTSNNYSSSVESSYELDLWGKLSSARDASEWSLRATALDRQNTALILITTIAKYYWDIATLNQEIINQQRSIDLIVETEKMAKSRFKVGAVSFYDVLQVEQTLLIQQAAYRQLQQQQAEARNALAILFNNPPSLHLVERVGLDIHQHIEFNPDLPLSALSKRPDVRAAEGRLRSQLAEADVMELSLYPTISIGASLRTGSDNELKDILSNPIGALSSSLLLPFVQWHKMKLNVEIAKLNVQSAAVTFQDTVYKALYDIEKLLLQRSIFESLKKDALKNLNLTIQKLKLATSQYEAGAVSINTLLDAQMDLIRSENEVLRAQKDYLVVTMQLWGAFGGGDMELPEPDDMQPIIVTMEMNKP